MINKFHKSKLTESFLQYLFSMNVCKEKLLSTNTVLVNGNRTLNAMKAQDILLLPQLRKRRRIYFQILSQAKNPLSVQSISPSLRLIKLQFGNSVH